MSHQRAQRLLIKLSRENVVDIIREREKLYSLLRQTSPKDLNTKWSQWSIKPSSRYSTRQWDFRSDHVSRLYKVVDEVDNNNVEEEEEVIECGKVLSKSWASGIDKMFVPSSGNELCLKSF